MPNTATQRFWLASLEASWKGPVNLESPDLSLIDWSWLLRAAKRHRVLESVHFIWNTLPGVPENVKHQSWVASEMARQRGDVIKQALNELQSIAEKHHLRIVLLKSPTYLAETILGFEKRYVQDIDILIKEEDLPTLSRELKCLGYQDEGRWRRHKGKEWLFHKEKVLVEVHLSASNRKRFQRMLSTKAIVDRATPFSLRPPLLRMTHSDEAILFVLHAYHHKYRELLWLRDFCIWWQCRNPDPNAILVAFKALSIERIGWMTWVGMEYLGWRLPDTWTPQLWACSSKFHQCIQTFWHRNAFQCEDTYGQTLLRQQLELRSAMGLRSKIWALFPLFSWRNISELYRLHTLR